MSPRHTRKEELQNAAPGADSWDSPMQGLADSLRAFGLELLHRECIRKPRHNVFVSPLSIFLALAMIRNGAGGTTKVAMRTALALPSYPSDAAIDDAVFALCKFLRSQTGIQLAIANALWADICSTLAPEFVHACEEIYNATVRTLDLHEPSAANAINEWVSEKTKGKIREIVTPESMQGSSAVLTNAIYFKARFVDPFPKQATKPGAFYLANGANKSVPMMRQFGLARSYRIGKRFEAAALQYEGSNITLFALLPQKGISPEEVLAAESVTDLFVEHEEVELDLSLPCFTVEFVSELKESLEQTGMAIAFKYPGADFLPLGSQAMGNYPPTCCAFCCSPQVSQGMSHIFPSP